jgi:hypothetical protein
VRQKANVSTFHKRVLAIGLPFVVVTPFVAIPFMYQAIGEHPRARRFDMFEWVITGQYMVNDEPLLITRLLLALWAVSCIAVIVLVMYGAVRGPRTAKGGRLDQKWWMRDASLWQVGDRAGWIEPNGDIHEGTVVEVHRRPFRFDGRTVDGVSGWPGLVMQQDDGVRFALGPATARRIAGTSGPSGTDESVRDEMNAAVLVGDEFTWIGADDELGEGVIVEKHVNSFTIGGRRIAATQRRPGYTVRRHSDGALIGLGSDLREAP